LRRHIGENASWCTFARWSSATIGESLRLDQPSRRLDELLTPWFLRPLRPFAQDFYRDVRMLSDGALPRMLAMGNHYVFHEIAYAIAELIAWYEGEAAQIPATDDQAWEASWQRYRESIKAFRKADEIFRPADESWLRDGLECYFRAMRCGADAARQSQYVLHGNILLAAYEQWRVDPILQVALDPLAKHLVEFRSTDPHGTHAPGDYPRPVVRGLGTQWALRHHTSVARWIADLYSGVLTKNFMTLDVPINDRGRTSILLGRGISSDDVPDELGHQRRLDDSELTKLIAVYDHNTDGKPRGATNWNSFAERMQFIVELFILLQHNKHLYDPIDPIEGSLLQLDLTDANLEGLRGIGDTPMDDYVAAAIAGASGPSDARTLVQALIRSGLQSSLTDPLPASLSGVLPHWAEREKVLRGQTFFRQRGLEIASALFTASLPQSYSAQHGARVLTTTAELASGNVNRRIAETGKMLLDVMTRGDESREPMSPGTPGSEAARGVRLFHAAVRHMVLAGQWDNSFGHPVNQEDLLGTLVVFTVVVLDSLDKMGVSVDADDAEAYVHLWMVVGYLLGIDFSLLRTAGPGQSAELTLPELRLVRDAIFRRNARASADGQSLTAALMHLMESTMPPGFRQFPAAASRVLLGDEYGDLLEVPLAGAPIRLAFHLTRPVTRLVSGGLVQRVLARPIQEGTTRMYRQWIGAHRGERPPWSIDDPEVRTAMRLGNVAPRPDRRAQATGP
jgi:hypothetical protein